MRATDDQKKVRVTLKERGQKGTKGYTVVDKHQVSEKTHERALEQGATYKVQGMQKLFEKLLKESGKEAIEGHEQEQDFVINKLKQLIEAEF